MDSSIRFLLLPAALPEFPDVLEEKEALEPNVSCDEFCNRQLIVCKFVKLRKNLLIDSKQGEGTSNQMLGGAR